MISGVGVKVGTSLSMELACRIIMRDCSLIRSQLGVFLVIFSALCVHWLSNTPAIFDRDKESWAFKFGSVGVGAAGSRSARGRNLGT